MWNVSIKQRGKIEQKREWEKIWPKWVGKSLSTALSGVTCREVGWIWRENGWLEGRYAARGVGEVVLAWYETETQSMKSLSLHWLGWLPHCCSAFIYGSKTTAWTDLKQSPSPSMISHTENRVAAARCLSFLLIFWALMTYLGRSKNLKGLCVCSEVEWGGNELRWGREDGLPFAPNFWQPELLLFAIQPFLSHRCKPEGIRSGRQSMARGLKQSQPINPECGTPRAIHAQLSVRVHACVC